MPRLFAAIPLSEDVRSVLAAQQNPKKNGIRWVDPTQLHITLCFLGDVPEHQIESIENRLNTLSAKHRGFTMMIDRLRFKAPAMVWAECQRSPAFDELYTQAHYEMAKVDPSLVWVAEEMRRPHPHVTMARLGRGVTPPKVQPLPTPLPLVVDRIDLMESELLSGGPVYRILHSFSLSV